MSRLSDVLALGLRVSVDGRYRERTDQTVGYPVLPNNNAGRDFARELIKQVQKLPVRGRVIYFDQDKYKLIFKWMTGQYAGWSDEELAAMWSAVKTFFDRARLHFPTLQPFFPDAKESISNESALIVLNELADKHLNMPLNEFHSRSRS